MYSPGVPATYDRVHSPPPPHDYYQRHHRDLMIQFPHELPPPSHHHPGYWGPENWSNQVFHKHHFGHLADTSYDSSCLSSLNTTFDNFSENGDSLASCRSRSKTSFSRSPSNGREMEQNISADSGYSESNVSRTKSRERKWSTCRKPLPTDALLAERIEKRRKRNRAASEKSRRLLVGRAEKGDHLQTVLLDVGGHLENIAEELRKLRIAKVSELLREVGVDPGRLVGEINKLTEYITKEAKGTLSNLSHE